MPPAAQTTIDAQIEKIQKMSDGSKQASASDLIGYRSRHSVAQLPLSLGGRRVSTWELGVDFITKWCYLKRQDKDEKRCDRLSI